VASVASTEMLLQHFKSIKKLGQLSLPSSTGLWLVLKWGVFTCVGWQVTLCDPIWQVTSRSSELGTIKSRRAVQNFYSFLPFLTFLINSTFKTISLVHEEPFSRFSYDTRVCLRYPRNSMAILAAEHTTGQI